MSISSNRAALIAGCAVLAVMGAALLIQDQRHGWPFSRHHGSPSVDQSNAAGAAVPVTSGPTRVEVRLAQSQIATLGIQFEPVEVRKIDNPVRAVATVSVDEASITHAHARISGWLERLYVNSTGQKVRAGEALAAVFSQELYSSQEELLSALRRAEGGQASALIMASRARLRTLGMVDSEIAEVERTGVAKRLVTIVAPAGGVVINRGVSAGTAVDPSTELVTLADLARVWIIAEVADGDAHQVESGVSALINFPTSGRKPFQARVEYVYPVLSEKTRTVRVRMSVRNDDGSLRPGMYGEVNFPSDPREALTVARDSIVDTGRTQHVFVHTAEDLLQPRTVSLGARVNDRVEVVSGLAAGEHVVTTGVFLIDSESRLRASGTSVHAGHGAPAPAADSRAQSASRSPHSH